MLSNLRVSNYELNLDTITIDTLSIIPNTIYIYDENNILIPDTLYIIDYAKSLFIPDSALKKQVQDVKISYRVFPYYFAKEYFHKDFSKLTPSISSSESPFKYTYKEDSYRNFFEKDELNKRGSISRGISFGNNQDIIVNSNLNLQLSGRLSENLEILAAISDNNIPIQPDGNSQQIQEFDKVYIQLFNKKTNLTVGDFEILRPPGNFMNLYKKVQGGIFSTTFSLDEKKSGTLKTSVSGAVSKGKYCRNIFQGKEGNQGPYKLTGSNNESFIIILAGTEKIYIDGKLLNRGQENDYVIDYNMAEITFTPNQPITKDKRIVAEYEYSEKNYARFLVFNSNEFNTKRGKYWLNVFSEQDSKNQPLQQELSDEQKQKLAKAGDSLNLALVPNIDSIEFDNSMVLYKKIDTIVGVDTCIYVYSTNPDSAFYRLGFSFVDENKGNYLPSISSANGRVYKWVAPENGVLQGSYEPVVLLITPKKKQLITVGGDVQISLYTKTFFEIALSNNDINTFSNKDASDDVGYAIKFKIFQKIPFKDTNNVHLNTSASYQLVNKYFDPVERFRSIEFERDWNLAESNMNENEHLLNVNINFSKKKLGLAKYDFDFMNRESGYNALKNSIHTKLKYKGFIFNLSGSLLNSEDIINNTNFLRYNALLSKQFSFITIGAKREEENNRWTRIETDSLLSNSFKYEQWEVFVNNPDTSKSKLFAGYKNRRDYLPSDNRLKYSTLGEDFNFGIHLLKNPSNIFKTTFTYRNLTITDTLLSNDIDENSVTTRIEHSLKLIKGVITTSTFYEIGSGLEIKKEFSYIEVAPGQGVYMWTDSTDYNNNGIKELDEFEIASFQDLANYIRVFTPTNIYIKTYTNQFNQLINLRPDRIWNNKKGLKKIGAKFSDQFAYRIARKNSQEDIGDISQIIVNANPFVSSINDSNLISIASSLRNTISFNRTSSKFGIDYIIHNNKNRMLLVNGFDMRTNQLNGLRFRWNISRKITIINNVSIGDKTYTSEYFSSKEYKIQYQKNEASLSFQPGLSFRVSLSYKYSYKQNIMNIEQCEEQNTGIEIKYNVLSKGNLSLKMNYINLSYNSETNTPVAYAMLEGFQPGDNATWSVLFQRNLANNLQLNLSYNGRISEGSKAVHTGGVQLRAYF